MLQVRLFSYRNIQRYCLGLNFNHIPVNAPHCPNHSYQCDGVIRTDVNLGGTAGYFPNSVGEWEDSKELSEPTLPLEGFARHYDHQLEEDHYEKPGNLFCLLDPARKQLLFENRARAMSGV